MSWVDGLLILVVGLLAYGGVMRGFISETFDILVIVLGSCVAFQIQPYLARFILSLSFVHWPKEMALIISFMVVFFVAGAGIFYLGCILDAAFKKLPGITEINKLGGGLVGFVKALIIAWFMVLLLAVIPFSPSFKATLHKGPVVNGIAGLNGIVDSVGALIAPSVTYEQGIHPTIERVKF